MRAAALFAGLAFCGAAGAGDARFAGVLKWRTVVIPKARLPELMGTEEQPEPAALFAVPVERLLEFAKDPHTGAEVRETSAYSDGTRLRTESPFGQRQDAYSLIDLDAGTSYVLMPAQRRYIEWTDEDLRAFEETTEPVRDLVEKRLEDAPPEARDRLAAAAPALVRPTETASPELRPLGETRKIDGLETAGYEVRTKSHTTIAWVAEGQDDVLAALRELERGREEMRPTRAPGEKGVQDVLTEHGLPVRVQTLGPTQYEVEDLIDVQRRTLPASLFAMPEGFEKTTVRKLRREAFGGDGK